MYRSGNKNAGPTRTMSVTPNVTDPDMRSTKQSSPHMHRASERHRHDKHEHHQERQRPDSRDELLADLGEQPDDMDDILFNKSTTAEEQQTNKTNTTILIIIFALVVIALIAIIIWIMMRDTDRAAEADVQHMMQRPPPMPQHRQHQYQPQPHQQQPQQQQPQLAKLAPLQVPKDEPEEDSEDSEEDTGEQKSETPNKPVSDVPVVKLVGVFANSTSSADDVLKQTRAALNPQYDDKDRELLNRKARDDQVTMVIELEEHQEAEDVSERVEVLE